MKRGVLFKFLPFVMTALVGCQNQIPNSEQKVIGGQKDSTQKFMLGLLESDSSTPFCGASLVAPGVAVTAADCVHTRTRTIWVAAASELEKDPATAHRYKVTMIDVHHDYKKSHKKSDLALISFDSGKESVSGLTPIGLDEPQQLPEKAYVLGWGTRSNYGHLESPDLHRAELPLVDHEKCLALGGRYAHLDDKEVCAGHMGTAHVDSCRGDVGGPLFVNDSEGRPQLIGIVSSATSCAQAGQPGIYTRVSAFKAWLKEMIETPAERELDKEGRVLSHEVLRHCRDQVHGSVVESNEQHQLRLFSHIHDLGAFAPLSERPEINDPSVCEWSTPSHRTFKVYHTHLQSQQPTEEDLIVEDVQAGQFFSAHAHDVVRSQLSCDLTGAALGNPMLFLGDDELRVRLDGEFYQWNGQFTKTDETTLTKSETAGLGCSVGDYRIRVLNRSDDGSSLEVLVKAPHLEGGEQILNLSKLKKQAPIDLHFSKADAHHGYVELHNTSDMDIVSWKLSCDRPLAFEKESASAHEDQIEALPQLSHEYSSAGSAWRVLKQGSTLKFAYRSDIDFAQGQTIHCKINSFPVAVSDN